VLQAAEGRRPLAGALGQAEAVVELDRPVAPGTPLGRHGA